MILQREHRGLTTNVSLVQLLPWSLGHVTKAYISFLSCLMYPHHVILHLRMNQYLLFSVWRQIAFAYTSGCASINQRCLFHNGSSYSNWIHHGNHRSGPSYWLSGDLSVKTSISQHIRPGSILWILTSLIGKMWGWIQLKAEEKARETSHN